MLIYCARVIESRKLEATAFTMGSISRPLDPISMRSQPAPATTSCFAASGALLAPGSSSHVGVNPSLGVSHSRSSLSDLSDSDVPMNPSPLDITEPVNPSPLDIIGCTVRHSIRAGRWLVLLILLAPDLRSSVPSLPWLRLVCRNRGRRAPGGPSPARVSATG